MDDESILLSPVNNKRHKTMGPLIEVSKQNFAEICEEIERILPMASFITIDGEFTGLEIDPSQKSNNFDLIKHRYLKAKSSAQHFQLIQFGLCLWTIEPATSTPTKDANLTPSAKILPRAYNFYLFKRGSNTETFVCQNNSMEFLSEHNMDFNKVIRDGISYMNETEEEKLKTRLEPKEKVEEKKDAAPNNKIELSKLNEGQMDLLNTTKQQIQKWYETTDEPTFDIPPQNGFIRRVFYEQFESLYPGQIQLQSLPSKSSWSGIQIVRIGNLETFQQAQQLEAKKKLQEAIGFRRVIKMILSAKVPIIGHNMLLDVAHVYEKFINPLPSDVEQFADELLKRFPGGIMDTKYIVKTQPSLRALLSMDTGLQKLFKATAGTEWNEGLLFSDYVETFSTPGLEHQAAYDAIVTGYVFLRLSHYVGRNLAKERPGTYMNVSSFAHLLPEYLNVLNVHNCDADLYLDRSRRIQVRQTRSDILLITGLSTAISTRDLRNAFKGYGITNVQWINDRYAYVQVSGTSSMQLDQLFRDVQNGSTSELKTSLLKLGINAIPFDTADENGIIDTILVGGKIETQERKPRVVKRTRELSAVDLLPNKKPLEIQEPKGSSCTIL